MTGQGQIRGLRYGHAWVEATSNEDGQRYAFDNANGRRRVFPSVAYRALGQVDQHVRNPETGAWEIQSNSHEYTLMDSIRHSTATGHYGPWHLETSSGL